MRKALWSGVFALCACALAVEAQHSSTVDFPLALNTRWTYHLHQENGKGVHFGEDAAPLAKNNILDATLISEAVAVEQVGAHSYTRVETRVNGKPWLFMWERVAPDGLLVGKSVDYEGGKQEILMEPEQKIISANFRPGNFWLWQVKDGSVRFRFSVIGPSEVDVPAGHFRGVHLNKHATVEAAFGQVEVNEDVWFVPGVGFAKHETRTSIKGYTLSHVLLTLEKIEKP
ncbi:MAG: hypothetical protein WCE61_08845 [Candidatus Acidiferrum sp.]